MSKYWHLSAGKMKVFSLGLLILSVLAVNAHAQAFLGSSWDFSVLGAQTVTNTGTTTLNADVGVSAGSAVTGSGSIVFTGPNNVITSTSAAAAGQIAATNAVNAINALVGTSEGPDLTGATLSATGNNTNTVYDVGAATFNIDSSKSLTLDFAGHTDANIIFVMSSTLITGSGSSVLIENARTNDNVYWEVGSSATLGTTTSFVGNIIAYTAVTLDTGATIGCGSVVAQNAAVTMDHNTISDTCSMSTSTPAPVTPTLGTTTVTVPEGGSPLLYLCFSLLPIGTMWAFRFRRSI